ncbi:hypothetical protein [Streptomyces sp. PT19]|uniref:hypothetical protein n=1 Tax=Streptomyces sp. PT19 TaxID=3452239 RepID=UPI003F7F74CD
MLDITLLQHQVIRDRVDALVNARGGLLVYEQGMGGRETLVAAAVGIAAATGKALTIVDADVLREATARLVEHFGLAEHTFLSPAQARNWPTGFASDAVLAVHGDVLRNQDLLEPLRAAAREASLHGHLVVARHPHGGNSLDAYTELLLRTRVMDVTPTTAETSPDAPPVASRAQSPDFQVPDPQVPTRLARETDQQAQALVQGWADRLELLNPGESTPAGLSGDAHERGRSYPAVREQLRGARLDAPDNVQQDTNGVFWVTHDPWTGPAAAFPDLEAKRKFLDRYKAARSDSALDLHPRTPERHNEASEGKDDSPYRSTQQTSGPAPDGRTAADGEEEALHPQRTTQPDDQVEPPTSAADESAIYHTVQNRIAKVQADTLQRLQQTAAALKTPLADQRASPRAARASGNDAAQRTAHEANAPAVAPSRSSHS